MPQWNETIYLNPAPRPDAPLRLEMAGITHPDPDYRIARRESPGLYVLEYVLRGRGHLTYGGEYYAVSAGDVYFLQPGAEMEYHSDRHDPWVKIWFNVRGK
ncbi:MAG: AraC family ligand binding domain-containing protein, partial [Lentisphaeria bacterium]|nr:AraC family ligand binding domain-containing protein [Lentisphaeria bacterium]